MIIEVVGMVDTEKIEKLIEEIAEEMRNAKSPEELEILERKVNMLEDLIDAIEGDKDLDKVAVMMDKVGTLMESIMGPLKELLKELYDPERMAAMGKSVADFYKNLVDAGMDKDAALELTKEYMASINTVKTLTETLMNMIGKKGGNFNIPIPAKQEKVRRVEIEKKEEEGENEE
jgi:GTP1/Obg family GTP-binding protein